MYSTATNLSRWNQFLLSGKPDIVEQDTLAQLLRPRVDTGPGRRYGYGTETRGTGEITTHGHGESVNGYRTHVLIQPATGLSVVVLSNLETADPFTIARGLASLASS